MNTTVQKTETAPANGSARRQQYLRPYYEVTDGENVCQIRVYLPGVPRDQATITLEKDTLLIEATRKDHWQEGWQPVHREMTPADYRLRLQVNVAIDEDRITATSQDGVLTLSVPVAEEAKPKTIAIE